eukprot:Nk52_evm14s234 gene=Nk52_evmTU14s234
MSTGDEERGVRAERSLIMQKLLYVGLPILCIGIMIFLMVPFIRHMIEKKDIAQVSEEAVRKSAQDEETINGYYDELKTIEEMSTGMQSDLGELEGSLNTMKTFMDGYSARLREISKLSLEAFGDLQLTSIDCQWDEDNFSKEASKKALHNDKYYLSVCVRDTKGNSICHVLVDDVESTDKPEISLPEDALTIIGSVLRFKKGEKFDIVYSLFEHNNIVEEIGERVENGIKYIKSMYESVGQKNSVIGKFWQATKSTFQLCLKAVSFGLSAPQNLVSFLHNGGKPYKNDNDPVFEVVLPWDKINTNCIDQTKKKCEINNFPAENKRVKCDFGLLHTLPPNKAH